MPRHPKPALLDRLGNSHCVIEASAGTGKTFTLEHLIVQLILEEVPLERILVVTFSRKATLEIQVRVRDKLTALLALEEDACPPEAPGWDLDEAARERLRTALMGFDRATISTIHGFCQQVLRDAAFEGGRLFQQEAVSSEDAFDHAFTDLLRTRFSTRQEGLLDLALRTLGLEGLRDLLQEALKEAPCLDLPPFEDARSFLEAFPEDLAQAFLRKEPIRDAFPESTAAIGKRLQELLDRRREALASGRPESLWLDGKWLQDLVKQLPSMDRPGLDGDAAILAGAVAGIANLKAILAAAFLPPLREALRRHKDEEGLYDFDDMIALVAQALDGPRGEPLAARLRERFKVALIDEFQDTDRSQWGIFRRIFLESPEDHRIFLVGDPKQAIYGFRSGDLPTYVEALEAVKARTGADPLQLTANFRSTPGVIAACNAILEDTEGTPFFSPANECHHRHPVTCGKPGLRLTGPDGELLPSIRAVDIPVGPARETRLQAAAALASTLKDTLARARFQAPGRTRPELGPEDVFVLTQTLAEGRIMARALQAEGIPASLYRQNGLFDGPEAKACRDLLLAIATPLDESRRARALLGPFFGFSFREAEAARELPEGHPILARLFRWRDLAQQGRYGSFFSRIVAESGVSQRLLFLDPGQRVLTNLMHILELLQQEALGGHRSLMDLAVLTQRWIEHLDRPAAEDAETQRLERQGGAAQVLTMHKSKGLQAPVVVLFGGTGAPPPRVLHRYHREGGARRAWLGPVKAAPAQVQAWIQQETREEGERLAYVALTRAEAQLIVPRYVPGELPTAASGSFEATGNPRQGLYRSVNRRLLVLLGPPGAPLGHPHIEGLPLPGRAAKGDPEPAAPWEAPLPAPLPEPDHAALARRARPRWLFSYTGLQQGLERLREEPALEEVREPSIPGGPQGGKRLGTLVHALLQRVDPASFQGRDLEAWSALPETAALAEALPAAARAGALEWVHHAFTRPLPLPGVGAGQASLCQAQDLLREMDFLTPYPRGAAAGEDFLTGSIDVLFRTGGRAYVLDWKTNRLPGYGPGPLEEAVQAHYLLQVKIYTLTAIRFLGIRDPERYEEAFGGVVYVFLRGLPEGGVWTCRPSWEDLQAWSRDLEALQPQRLIPIHAGGERHGG